LKTPLAGAILTVFPTRRRLFAPGRNVWDNFAVPIYLEKFVLPLCVTVVVLVWANPMKLGLDLVQKISLSVAVIAFAYFVAHTLHKARPAAPASQAPAESEHVNKLDNVTRGGPSNLPPPPVSGTTSELEPPKGPHPKPPRTTSAPPAIGPRLGIGPEAYKDVPDEQVGQWAIEEADKIEEMASTYISRSTDAATLKAQIWFFSNDFKSCCAQDVKDLRTEILRRLGPPAKDPNENQAWKTLFRELWLPPGVQAPPQLVDIDPMDVKRYAPYLGHLGLKLKRRNIPRAAPSALHFSVQRIPAEKPEFPYRILVTIDTSKEIGFGYVVVQFEGPLAGVGCDFRDSKLVFRADQVENKDLAKILETNMGPRVYALQVGKTPFTPETPIHVVAFGKEQVRVAAVTFFDE